MTGYLGRQDWAPSGEHTILSGRDGLHAPAWVVVQVEGQDVTDSQLQELAALLNADNPDPEDVTTWPFREAPAGQTQQIPWEPS